jgi:hypothetical protein
MKGMKGIKRKGRKGKKRDVNCPHRFGMVDGNKWQGAQRIVLCDTHTATHTRAARADLAWSMGINDRA